jgi:uncharacterized membrane protein
MKDSHWKDNFWIGFFILFCIVLCVSINNGVALAVELSDEETTGVLPDTAESEADGFAPEDSLTPAPEPSSLEIARADLAVALTASAEEIKAGQSLTYEAALTNQGEQSLTHIQLRSVFSRDEVTGVWKSDGAAEDAGENGAILIDILAPGETVSVSMEVQIPEEQKTPIDHTLYVTANTEEGKTIGREAASCVTVVPVSADFEVEKRADRTVAFPGDTINYQITIRNTGERTLHSIVTTERFQSEEIEAVFLPQEGVKLNSDRTKAYIASLTPGNEIALKAQVTLPGQIQEQELINQVVVLTEETGNSSSVSEAAVQVRDLETNEEIASPLPTPSPEPEEEKPDQAEEKSVSRLAMAVQTGDVTQIGRPVRLLFAACLLILLGLVCRQRGKKH